MDGTAWAWNKEIHGALCLEVGVWLMQNHFRIVGGGGGRREEKKCLQGAGSQAWACCKPASPAFRAAPPSPLLRTAWPGSAERSFSLLGGSRNFFQVSFFLSKGHYAQDALFLAARPLCEGRKLAGLVTMQIATVKAS